MDIWSQYAVDPILEAEGKAFPFGDATITLARSYSPKYNNVLNQLYEAHKHTLDDKSTPEAVKAGEARSVKIMAEVLSKTVVLGWTNLSYKGQPLPYSVANAEMILQHKDFQKEVGQKADDYKNYRFAVEEADAKNSSTTSSGTSPGEVALSNSAS